MTIAQTLLQDFDPEMAGTRRTLERIPDLASYKPNDQSMAMGRLAAHVATLPLLGKGIRSLVYRTVFFNHLIHHRAQLGVCLRLNNIPVPGLYGPSADEVFQP